MTNEPRANKDSVLIKTSTAQPGGGWWGVCHRPVQGYLMGITQPLPRGDFRQHQEQVLQAACLHIKVASPDYLSCGTLSFSWGRVTDGGGMVTPDCMVQPGKVNWKGESLHPSVLPPEPQMLSWGRDVGIPISKQTGQPKRCTIKELGVSPAQRFLFRCFLAPHSLHCKEQRLVAGHCSGTDSWDTSRSSELILGLPLEPFGVLSSSEGCGWHRQLLPAFGWALRN